MLKDRLRRQLLNQVWVERNENIAGYLAEHVEVAEYDRETLIYQQDTIPPPNQGYCLWMLLSGEVVLSRNGHRLRALKPGECFGEFPLLDPSLKYTVDALVKAGSAVARLSEEDFNGLAESYPAVGLSFARILVQRLVSHDELYRPPNSRPKIFIGSSSEAVSSLNRFTKEFEYDQFDLKKWTGDIFEPSETAIEALVTAAESVDFAVLIGTPDDAIERRMTEGRVPRDNIIFELGLFVGSIGRKRTMFVYPRNAPLILPSDLLGVTPLTFEPGSDEVGVFGPVAEAVRAKVKNLGTLARLVNTSP